MAAAAYTHLKYTHEREVSHVRPAFPFFSQRECIQRDLYTDHCIFVTRVCVKVVAAREMKSAEADDAGGGIRVTRNNNPCLEEARRRRRAADDACSADDGMTERGGAIILHGACAALLRVYCCGR